MSQVLRGCHKCGGHPQHPSAVMQRYKLYRCNKCGTLTCNQHLIGLLGNVCPTCNTASLTLVAVRDTKPPTNTTPKSKDTVINPTEGRAASPTKEINIDDVASVTESAAAQGFGLSSRAVPQTTSRLGSAAFDLPTLADNSPRSHTLAAEFVAGMMPQNNAIKNKAAMAAVEFIPEGTDNPRMGLGKGLGAWASVEEAPPPRAAHKAAQAAIGASSATVSEPSAHDDDPTPTAPEELPDPASLRGGIIHYTDAGFYPLADDGFASLSTLLDGINTQLSTGKNMRIINLVLDYHDVTQAPAVLLELLQKYPFIRLTLGYGPRQATNPARDMPGLEQFINTTPHVIALHGGLDLHFAAYSKDAQLTCLNQQVALANHLGKPMYISAIKADAVLLEGLTPPNKGIYASPLKTDDALELCKKHTLWVCTRSELTLPEHDDYRQRLGKIPTGKVLLGSGSALVVPARQEALGNSPLFMEDIARVLMQVYKYQKLEAPFNQAYKNLYSLLAGR